MSSNLYKITQLSHMKFSKELWAQYADFRNSQRSYWAPHAGSVASGNGK